VTVHIDKPRVRVAARSQTMDSFQNVAARLGIGTDTVASGASYTLNPITRQRSQLEWMYRGSWLVGQAVDSVAEDMTRAGVDFTSAIPPDDLATLQGGIDRRGIWSAIEELIKWGRLYGGAIAVHMVDGQDLATPLLPDRTAKGQYKGLFTLDRWNVIPSFEDLVQDPGPDTGKPRFYDVMVSAPAFRGQRIHHSRVIRYEGISLPYWQRVAEYGWGLSIVERLYDRLVAFDSTTQGAAQLVYKAHLRTVKVDKLRDILAEGGPAEAALVKMFQMIRQMQSNEGLTLIDGADEFETHSYTFAGMSDVLLQFAQQLSGALQIPLVRLFGQSPAGLNATGESDIRFYYDTIQAQQESRLRPGFATVVDQSYRSEFGRPPPDDLSFTFNPLWQMSETEKATIAVGVTNAVTQAFEAGIVDQPTAMRELRQSADVTGIWSNIDDEAILAAENEPPAPGETDEPDPAAAEPDDGRERAQQEALAALGVDAGAEG